VACHDGCCFLKGFEVMIFLGGEIAMLGFISSQNWGNNECQLLTYKSLAVQLAGKKV